MKSGMAPKRKSDLTVEQLEASNALYLRVRDELNKLACGDERLLFAYRRRVFLKLLYDERGKPAQRRALKLRKMKAQNGICALCPDQLPEKGAELDRLNPFGGYTDVNTRLVHHDCHVEQQKNQG